MRFPKGMIIILLSLLTTLLPVPGPSADLDLHSATYAHLFQEDQVIGSDADYAPLFEYITLDIWEAGKPELSFHLHGWGKADLRDDSYTAAGDGYISSAQIRYISGSSSSKIRAGRMLLSEGTTLEAFDGLHVRKSFGRTGLALYGGKPNGGKGSGDDRGDTMAGARVFILSPGKFEIGLNYLQEDGDFGGDEREEAGADLWLAPGNSIQITGYAVYNNITSGLASDDVSMLLTPSPVLDITLATEGYIYENLFQAVTNPAFLSSAINLADEVRITKSEISWYPSRRLDVLGIVKKIDHKEDDPGTITRTEVGFDISKPVHLDRIGIRVAVQTGDISSNEYNEMRAYCMASAGAFRWSVDALTQEYEEEIGGENRTTQLVGSAGWRFSDNFDLSGDLRLTKSPVFDEDLAVFIRAHYDFGNGAN